VGGDVVEGPPPLDPAALPGESVPRDAGVGDSVLSGCVNQAGLLRVRVTKPYGESTVARVLDLVENASEKKSRSEQFITRFARYYTPCVVLSAAALFAVPSILLAVLPGESLPGFLLGTDWLGWLHRALIFLVISCPCALVISVPLSFFGGIGGAGKCGILVKGGNYLEALAKAETVVFDKTGTLTQGTFTVAAVHPEAAFTQEALLEYAALAEQWSDHPIAQSLREACKAPLDAGRVTDVEELAAVTLGKSHILFEVGDTELICRRLEGEFLDYKNAIPRKNPISVIADTKALIESIDRVSVVISEKQKSPVRCLFDHDKVLLSAKTGNGEAKDICRLSGDGGGLEIGFNNRYLMEALRYAPADTVKIELNTGVSPAIIVPTEGEENFLYMVLPVRLKSAE